MAQWVPKTSWKLSNLNKMYGVEEIGIYAKKTPSDKKPVRKFSAPFLTSPYRPVPAVFSSRFSGQDDAAADFDASRRMLKAAYDAQVPFIDLRDEHEHSMRSLKNAIHLHHHDILSGACNEILPEDRRNAQIVVFASSPQRAVNGYKALRRWGFESVIVADAESVLDFDAAAAASAPEGKAEKKQQHA